MSSAQKQVVLEGPSYGFALPQGIKAILDSCSEDVRLDLGRRLNATSDAQFLRIIVSLVKLVLADAETTFLQFNNEHFAYR